MKTLIPSPFLNTGRSICSFLAFTFFAIFSFPAQAQVTLSGALTGNYPTLMTAFNAINNRGELNGIMLWNHLAGKTQTCTGNAVRILSTATGTTVDVTGILAIRGIVHKSAAAASLNIWYNSIFAGGGLCVANSAEERMGAVKGCERVKSKFL